MFKQLGPPLPKQERELGNYNNMQDILLDDDNDLFFTDDDFVIGSSDLQHQKLLLFSEKGSWKELPGTGVGSFTYLENEDRSGFFNEVRVQFSADGMTVKSISFNDGKIEIDAEYKSQR